MKKIFSVVLVASMMFIGTKTSAQWTAGGGFVSTSFSGKDSQVADYTLPGFYFGGSYDVAFSTLEGLTVEPGVYFQHFGKTMTYSTLSERSYHANYFSVPVNIKYAVEAGEDIVVAGYTGPRFNVGFAGNAFDTKRLGLKNFDAQWGFGTSMTYAKAVELRAGYDLGLTKALKNGDELKVRRNAFHIGVAFLF